MPTQTTSVDQQSEGFLTLLSEQERIKANKVAGVKSVLVVLSAKAMVYDTEALRQKIVLTYPDSAVFFRTASGQSVGVHSPNRVDLLIDLTSPRTRQGLFFAQGLRRIARVAVGRNVGFLRKRLYDRVYDEKPELSKLPQDILSRERIVQRRVLELAGVPLAQKGDLGPDLGKTIALDLPSMQKL